MSYSTDSRYYPQTAPYTIKDTAEYEHDDEHDALSSTPVSPDPTPFHFQFRLPTSSSANGHVHALQSASSSSSSLSLPHPSLSAPLYRFATPGPMHPHSAQGHPHAHMHNDTGQHGGPMRGGGNQWSVDMDLDLGRDVQRHGYQHQSHALPYEYEDEQEDLPHVRVSGGSGRQDKDKVVRKRSSKACDQCRKSKCKCERNADGESCKNCVIMNTACTFLGPSRKRGPPKGYIDAIEARLHQVEALVGTLLFARQQNQTPSQNQSPSQSRAQHSADGVEAILQAWERDRGAREVLARVGRGAYGPGGREGGGGGGGAKERGKGHTNNNNNASRSASRSGSPEEEMGVVHPTLAWQDGLTALLLGGPGSGSGSGSGSRNDGVEGDGDGQGTRRTRRRLSAANSDDDDDDDYHGHHGNRRQRDQSPSQSRSRRRRDDAEYEYAAQIKEEQATDPTTDSLLDAVGQLSLNEDEEVRYHGKASGLHLLAKEPGDKSAGGGGRNEGGIWRFPRARVWPPLPAYASPMTEQAKERERERAVSEAVLPDMETQERLLEVYFAYVHPCFPIVDKAGFWEMWRNGGADTPGPSSPTSESSFTSSGSPFSRRRRHTPPLLLLAMLAIAERLAPALSDTAIPPPGPDATHMWAAGDAYLDAAKTLLDTGLGCTSSRPSTCQALLLLGYREVGIGAMAQAWVFVGLAIRIAQDLGLHRAADGWARAGLGGTLFDKRQLAERRRIWWGCVGLDRYLSAYMGRPLGVFDGDWDTGLPEVDEAEEMEAWAPHPSAPIAGSGIERETGPPAGTPAHIGSCFKASTTLAIIMGRIVLGIYGLKPGLNRPAEFVRLEGQLDKWFLDLPVHLRYDPSTPKCSPLPVMALHMQYWCSVLLLHRPFIGWGRAEGKDDPEARSGAKNYEICAAAANHIASIVYVYSENYYLTRAPVFFCYVIFTASIMHVNTLSAYPSDPQARMSLAKCMDALKAMRVVWPGAGRALELIRESRVNAETVPLPLAGNAVNRHKRSVDDLAAQDRSVDQRGSYAPQGYRQPSYLDGPQKYTEPFVRRQQSSSQLPSDPPPYYAAPDRWPDSYAAGAAPQPAPLSTAVLPQLYTGVAEERHPESGVRYRQQGIDSSSVQSRMPQFWNDLTSFSQLNAYATSPQEQSSIAEPSSMYISDPYNLYSNPPS